jgi:tricarboxylate carrier
MSSSSQPSSTNSTLPPFNPNRGSPHDLTTYIGRVQHFLDVIDPRSLFYSQHRVHEALKILDEYNNTPTGLLPRHSDAELWDALKVKQAVINPGTGQSIPLPFRMSAFVPMNVPIIWGMLSSTSPMASVFWQWVNQSYNSCLNYANRSGTSSSSSEIAQSYVLAVSTAIGISYGVGKLGEKGPKPIRSLVRRVPFIVPYLAVAGAGAANVYASRRTEILHGIPVYDSSGNQLGISKEAARQGVFKTIVTRSLTLPLPVLVLPPIITQAALPVQSTPQTRLLFELTIITMCLAGALPLTIAMYPQNLELSVDVLEPEFKQLKDSKTGKPIEKVFCNKGL